ncbi:hypothetical protein HMPREF0063_12589 [Aeromicrobium marinum DSM 15272]|uniref:SalK n=1 Tax=Aeromicrobium marinum DSM 15272 TaxID=585531 RepID=E2SEY0_9ACTN|nr:hypothetical protein [Aeromicrobium marinum]EFQ82224.1 hypothetical protein HMPREF0063_12589 [Aeromicrobium marinum DSM 15272]
MTVPTPFWRSIESLHHFIYLVPETGTHYAPLGLKGTWMGYFASRAAPMGAASPELVTATFHGFAPSRVHRAIPDAWALASPEQIHASRLDLAREVLGRVTTDEHTAPLADTLATIAAGLDLAGKPLAAAHASLTPPADGIARFWLAGSVIREFRGDCHIALLVGHGLGGVDANVLNVAAGRTFPQQQALRGWTDEEWAAGVERLRARGWLDADGAITTEGTAFRDELEDATDRACLAAMSDEAVEAAVDITDALRDIGRDLRAALAG